MLLTRYRDLGNRGAIKFQGAAPRGAALLVEVDYLAGLGAGDHSFEASVEAGGFGVGFLFRDAPGFALVFVLLFLFAELFLAAFFIHPVISCKSGWLGCLASGEKKKGRAEARPLM
jgi:hypothetical protein